MSLSSIHKHSLLLLSLVAAVQVVYADKPKISLRPDTIKQKIYDVGEIGKNDYVRFIYDVDFAEYFDNREYHQPYQIPQTFLNFRLSPIIGVRVRDRLQCTHELVAGVHYTQPLGGNWHETQVDPTAYYSFSVYGFKVQLGAVPYTNRILSLPDYLMYDSIAYMHPNIQGALMSYQDKRGYVSFMCDWRGSQTLQRREMFRLVLDGRYQYKWLQLGGIGQINHKAGFAKPNHEGVCDDVYVNPQIGFDISRYARMDSLAIRLNYIFGLQRYRTTSDTYTPQGLMVELYANWWFIGIRNIFYFGDNLMPLYQVNASDGLPFTSRVNQGDPFYQAHWYNRTDVFAYLYRNNFVNCYFSWNFHYDGFSLQHQQQLITRFSLGGMRSEKKLRNILDK